MSGDPCACASSIIITIIIIIIVTVVGKSRISDPRPFILHPSIRPSPCSGTPPPFREYPPLPIYPSIHLHESPSSPSPHTHTHILRSPCPLLSSLIPLVYTHNIYDQQKPSSSSLSPSCPGGNARGGIFPKWPRRGDDDNSDRVDSAESHGRGEEKI